MWPVTGFQKGLDGRPGQRVCFPRAITASVSKSGQMLMSLDLGETILQLDWVTRNLRQDYPDRRNRSAQLLRDAAAVSPPEARSKAEHFCDPFLAA